jgi:hypothetical protein
VAAMAELPSAAPSDAREWERLLAGAALSCAGMTTYLKEGIDDWFVTSYVELLSLTYPSAAALEGVTWAEAEECLRRHIVTGGLTIEERERLYLEHRARVMGGT